MANPFAALLTRARSLDLSHPATRHVERKFTVADASVDWQRINSLVYGPSATPSEANDGNSAAFACLRTLASSFIEPHLRVWRDIGDGQPEALNEHPLQILLDKPNPAIPPVLLWWWCAWVLNVDGNAYFFKARAGNAERGNVVQLWPISPETIRPKTNRGSDDFISYYEHGSQKERIPVANIVHIKLGIDDRDMRRGLSPFKRLVRAIATDDEAERYVAAFLGNYGVPGTVVKTKDRQMSEADALEIKRKFAAEFSGDGRGRVGVLNNDADVTVVGSNLAGLDLSAIRNFPESRIAAVLGVPPELAGLHVGVTEGSAAYASSKQIAENFTERTLVPLWRIVEESAQLALEDDFLSDPNLVLRYDLSTVRALQEDQDALHARLREDMKAGGITVQEFRTGIGLPPEMEPQEIVLVATTETPTLVSDMVLMPAPEPVMPPALPPADGTSQDASNTAQDAQGSANGGKSTTGSLQWKARRSRVLTQWPELLDAMVELAEPAFERDLNHYFDGARKRAIDKVTGQTNGVTH